MTSKPLSGLALLAAATCCLGAQYAGLERIEAIAGLEKRSRGALEFAKSQLDTALDAYRRDDTESGKAALDLVGEAVEMAVESLRSTGKHPRQHPRHFKHAEIRTRRLLKLLRQARGKAHLQDQGDFDPPIERVERANGALLLGIMSPKK